MRLLIGGLLLMLGLSAAKAESDIELLNATLVAKFHFAEQARDGKMVGAYQVSFRNMGETPATKVSLLLNPGLQLDHVIGPSGKKLKTTSRIVPVEGGEHLELMQVEVTLYRPLIKNKPRQEIIVHYSGYLEDLSQTGLMGVKETLHPDFTMVRAQSFGYPVFSKPDIGAIQTAWNHKPFYQVAFLDIPGTNTVVGTLHVVQKTTDGDTTKFEMKNDLPSEPMVLAIARFKTEALSTFDVARLTEQNGKLGLAISLADKQSQKFHEALGPAPSNRRFTLIETPPGYTNAFMKSVRFIPTGQPLQSELKQTQKTNNVRSLSDLVSDDQFHKIEEERHQQQEEKQATYFWIQQALFSIWRTNQADREDHWGLGLDSTLFSALIHEHHDGKAIRFLRGTDLLKKEPLPGKTALVDFAIESLGAEERLFSGIAFDALFELLGPDDFFALVRGMRAHLSSGYVDMQSVADYLDMNIENPKARQFAANWFSRGRIGKDMAKANSFKELVALYR